MGRGSPQKILIVKTKIWPKIQRVRLNNFRASGSILTRLFQSTPGEAGVINLVQFLQCPPSKICDGQKIAQNFSRFLTTFDFDREYLRNKSTYQKSEKLLIIYIPGRVRPKNLAYFGPQTKKLLTLINVHPNGIFFGKLSRPLWGAAPWNFYTR